MAVSVGLAVVVLFGPGVSRSVHAQPCASSAAGAPGQDFSGQDLRWKNFAHQDLTSCNFAGATLTGTVFIHANLSGANFSNAVVSDSQDVIRPTDFSFANLTGASFKGARFNGPTYFTYATLTRADFSATNLRANAIFGPSLSFDRSASLRPAFRQTTMDCEFVDDWKDLDLSGATISACELAGRNLNLSGAEMSSVDFSSMDLTGVRFHGANLSGAIFTSATLKSADLSESRLYGAKLNNANLEGADLGGALLTNNPPDDISQAADLTGAYMKNVNLANAQLSGAAFTSASFYSTNPVGPGTTCDTSSGFTKGCASARGATLNNTQFNGAYLFGVDFTNATMTGVSFSNAVLIGSNFSGASLSFDSHIGTGAKLDFAYLQGTQLASATLNRTSLQAAFVDFSEEGNTFYLLLDEQHTKFPGYWGKSGPVCVSNTYFVATTVPTANTTLTCPDGFPAGTNGCGPTMTSRWASHVDIANNDPRLSYQFDATYTKAMKTPICQVDDDGRWSK
jgi:uncharacterized protein YjbI with pentapeptide repeats